MVLHRACRPLCLLAATFAASAHASVITDSILQDRLIGAWALDGGCAFGTLTFNADGTFSMTDTDPKDELRGSFSVQNGLLIGHADTEAMPTYPVQFDANGSLVLGGAILDRCKPPPTG